MRKILYIAAAALLCASCFQVNTNYTGGKNAIKGTGSVISKTMDFKDFDSIVINGGADVKFTQSSTYEVTVRTQENIFDWLDYKVEGTTLVLQLKDKKGVHAEVFDIVIQAPELKKLTVNGATDFDVDALRMDGDLDIEINGAGDLDFNRITCNSLTLEVNGAADAKLTAVDILKSLKVEVNGAGDVDITGNALDASFEVNGAGDIDATGLKIAGEVKQRKAGIASIRL